ncbi:unnamed protein product [Didymodactylos carnosus]|uniref:Uncharacterized protein n=1 Tax=Didymodactylos carnosus TaxID=1234261 RepID=A0A814GBJ0_9BILA|nr:unnamed protein product [Didymodactylos carnosus]CAF3764771.1 unnamed protein product [Didymodactylos carnosus]
MMAVAVLLLSLLLTDLVRSQIPNPSRYRFTLTINGTVQERYVIDKELGKMSRLWFSKSGDELFGGNQNIYVRDDGRTYLFNFMSQPPQCIANRGGPYNEMNYWANLVQSWGGENQTYDKLVFDADCDGICLTWYKEYNSTYYNNYHYQSRLYVKKAEQKPIKIVTKVYGHDTGKLISTDVMRFASWSTDKTPDYEFDYPMDLKTCYYP